MYMTIFGRTGLIIGLYGVVFHKEFDGHVHKRVVPLVYQDLSIFIEFYRYFFDFSDFRFSAFFKAPRVVRS